MPGVLTALALLWLAGAAMRLPILAVPPVVRLIHDDLHMSETQVGLLIGIPLLMFALAAIPGSLLIARGGAGLIVVTGLLIAALASAGRAISFDLWTLYGMTVLMGFGIAIMQPAVPTLVRQWLPDRVAFGTAVSSNGLMVGVAAAPALSIPLVLPLVGQSWRLDLLVWSVPSLIAALLFLAVVVRAPAAPVTDVPRLWWPDWRNPLIWLLGLTFGCNNAFYYSVNAFLPDYLNSAGRAELIGPVLGWLNISQLIASFVLMATARWLHRRAVSYLVFGLLPAFGVLGIVLLDGVWVVLAASRHRLLARRHLRGDVRAAAGAGAARRRAPHGGRHVRHRLRDRRDRSGDLRRAVGPDRRALDRVPAGRRMRAHIDRAGRGADAPQPGAVSR